MEYLRLLKPEIFVDEPYDIFARLAAWLRSVFSPPARSSTGAGHEQQRP
jgi:hypothetical protein